MSLIKIKKFISEMFSKGEALGRSLRTSLKSTLTPDNIVDEYGDRKRRLGKALNQYLTSFSGKVLPGVEEAQDLTQEILCEFFESYIKPYYSILGGDLADFVIDYGKQKVIKNSDLNITAFYDERPNKVYMYPNEFDDIITMIEAFAHEYEHNLQCKGCLDFFNGRNVQVEKSKVRDLSDKYPWELKKNVYFQERVYSSDTIKSLYQVHKGGKYKTMQTPSDNYLSYFRLGCERDARVASYYMMIDFFKDMINYSKEDVNNNYFLYLVNWYQNRIEQENQVPQEFQNYLSVLDSLDFQDYVDYANNIIKKERFEYVKAKGKYVKKHETANGENIEVGLEPLYEHFFRQYERKVLFEAALFYCDYLEKKGNKMEVMVKLARTGNTFVFESLYDKLFGYYVNEELSEKLEELFKSGEVCEKSFELINYLNNNCSHDVFANYLRSGKFKFCELLLYNMINYEGKEESQDQIFHYIPYYDRLKDKWRELCRKNVNSQNGAFAALKDKFIELKEQQEEGTLVFDDIDDYIKILSSVCDLFDVDYKAAKIDFDKENVFLNYPFEIDNSVKSMISKTLFDLYLDSEILAYNEVCRKLKGKQNIGSYCYNNAKERQKFRLQGEEADKRYREIYGETAYQSMKLEREQRREEERIFNQAKMVDEYSYEM